MHKGRHRCLAAALQRSSGSAKQLQRCADAQGMAAAQSAAAACADGESTALQSLLRWAAGALLAAGAAAIAIPHEPARCDAGGMPAPSAEPPPSPDELETTGDLIGFSAVSTAVERIWEDLDYSLHRQEAATSGPGPMGPRGTRSPIVTQNGDRLVITVPLRRGVDVVSFVSEVVNALTGVFGRGTDGVKGGSTTVKVGKSGSDSGTAVVRFEPIGGRDEPASGLEVRMYLNRRGGEAPRLELSREGVALTPAQRRIVADVLRAANTVDGLWGPGIDPFGRFFDVMLRDMLGTIPGGEEFFTGLLGMGGPGDAAGRPPFLSGEDGPMERLPRPRPAEVDAPRGRRREPPAAPAAAAPEPSGYDFGSPESNAAARKLEGMGAIVHPPGNSKVVDWGLLAGYEQQKAAIEDTLLLALQHPDVFDDVARGTRKHFASNRPRAVLFEGPPGCGKTTSARCAVTRYADAIDCYAASDRVIASQAAVPLVYVPIEAVASKWYGESERLLSDVFRQSDRLSGCIVFLDELDSLAASRGGDMHEATRKLLGVLLREMDGFDRTKRSVVIGATNRKADLDPALLSRFDTVVDFPLPDNRCRHEILRTYAQQLSDGDLEKLAAATPGMSGRDLRDVCEQAERRWASKIISQIIRGEVQKGLPPLDVYMAAAEQRAAELRTLVAGPSRGKLGLL